MWWIVFAAICVVGVLPLSIMYVRDKIKPMDIVNDYGAERRIVFALGWLALCAVIQVVWLVHGIMLKMAG